jgi:hypothetical protein
MATVVVGDEGVPVVVDDGGDDVLVADVPLLVGAVVGGASSPVHPATAKTPASVTAATTELRTLRSVPPNCPAAPRDPCHQQHTFLSRLRHFAVHRLWMACGRTHHELARTSPVR